MSYLYYPGCSLKGTGRPYEESLLSLFKKLDLSIKEIDDWNCCGATAYMSFSELKAYALCARNFALAESQNGGNPPANLVVPCAACYLGLSKAKRYLNEYPDLRKKINDALLTAGLTYNNHVNLRHPIDILVNDVASSKIKEKVVNSLSGLRVASYYGCQLVRPYSDFDDQDRPMQLDNLVELCGAEAVDWPLKTRCCGGSLSGTIDNVGLRLIYILLKEAKRRHCDAIITACPLCQFNLECYQKKISDKYDDDVSIPVTYFTQLIGVALGIPDNQLGLHRHFTALSSEQLISHDARGEYVSK
jgi:heterodisulfide reductase subunit B